ncbi:MAG: hypothetical protein M1828_006160 [Chrysothrix sp. TS-e1954]|nr:MAG: hypothetical protein M1828_006160 [Chrysothrix sp. TS-e1954]
MLKATSPQNASPVSSTSQNSDYFIRVPKLKVRSQSNVVVTLREQTPLFESNITSLDGGLVSTPSTSSSSLPGSRSAASFGTPSPPVIKKAKNKSGLLGFLTLKEPSQAAFEEFGALQRRQDASKNSKPANASRTPQKKLPDCVPKVNSSWDGMPDVARERRREMKSTSGEPWHRNLDSKSSGDITPKRSISTPKSSKSPSARVTPYDGSRRPSFEQYRRLPTEDSTKNRAPQIFSSEASHPQIASPLPTSIKRVKSAKTLHKTTSEPSEADTSGKTLGTTSLATSSHTAGHDVTAAPEQRPSHVAGLAEQPDGTLETPQVPTQISSHDSPLTFGEIIPGLVSPAVEKRHDEMNPSPEEMSASSGPLDQASQGGITIVSTSTPQDNNPQWPLPANAEETIFESAGPGVLSPPLSAKEGSRSPASEGRGSRSNSIESLDDVPGLHTPKSSKSHSPSSSISPQRADGKPPPRNFTRPFAPTQGAVSPVSPPRSSPRSVNRIAANSYAGSRTPSTQIGRPITKDSNLATIPESDTASFRLSIQNMKYQQDGNFDARAGADADADADAQSLASSRASSEMSASWLMSPKERLGLGGLIKHDRRNMPWPMPGEEDQDFVIGERSGSPLDDRDRGRRKTNIMGVFRR